MRKSSASLIPTVVAAVLLHLPAQATRAYWQQDVAYDMDVKLDQDGRTLLGHLRFHYRNNSPDTLTELRFHAHYNSMRLGSPMARRLLSLGERDFETASPDDYASFEVHNLQDGYGRRIEPLLDCSIFRVPLSDPLPSGGEIDLVMDFSSRIPGPGVAYRTSAAHGQLKVAHWYPQVCVYDPVMGWVDNQYLGWGEVYGEFGTYDVALTLPEPFIVGATGSLINRSEVLPDTLMEALKLANHLDWPWGTAPDTTFGDWSRTKTWRFHAENVHDFAFVADPQFRLARDHCGNTDIWILARQDHASGWHDAAEVTRQGMEILEREIGPFPYSEFTVVDCYSGMEYPGIVFCGGSSPDYKLLFWHEMTHNYFMGALGSNQTDRPFMDEGFTTYWEIRIMEELIGIENVLLDQWESWYVMDKDRWHRGLRPYLLWQKSGYALPLHIESDQPNVYMQYRVSAYYKPVSMLFALQYMVGEEGTRRIMRAYYDTWKFRHPYEQDFFRCAEEILGTSLQWFYDSWMRGAKSLDYSVDKVRSEKTGKTTLLVRRHGDMIMPVKVDLENQLGQFTTYFVPIDDEPTPPDCDVRLPRWDQVRDPYPEYTFQLQGTAFRRARLDPEGFLADVNPLNNSTSLLPPVKMEFDHPLEHVSPVDAYRLRCFPTVFHNGVDGLQIGGYVKGDYLEQWHRTDLSARVGALTGRVSAELDYDNAFPALGQSTRWGLSAYTHEGQRGAEVRLRHLQQRGLDLPALWEGSIRWRFHELFDRAYPPDPSVWEEGLISSVILDAAAFPEMGNLKIEARSSLEAAAPFGDFTYSRLSTELVASYPLTSSLALALRGFMGKASDGTPTQDLFGLGGGGPLMQSRIRWLRAWGSLPPNWDARAIGDGNLRGYSSAAYLGKNVVSMEAAITHEMKFLRPWMDNVALPKRYRPVVQAFIFAEAGDVASAFSRLGWENSFETAGAGMALSFHSGSQIELALPMYLSHPAEGEEHLAWRATLGFALKK